MLLSRVVSIVPWSLRRHVKRVPGISWLQRRIVDAALNDREFIHEVDAGPARGVRFVVQLPEDKGIWTGTYEIDFATRLAAAVEPGMVAYDIGSWHGFFAGVMAAQGAREVHVFEPLPANAERIRRLVALNLGRSITLHPCAVGERDTEMELIVMPETSMAKLEASSFQSGQMSSERLRVKVRSIDAMIEAGEIAPPALMKIDVEGAEAMVLAGAHKMISTHRPVIFAEVHSAPLLDQCRTLLEAEGYDINLIDANPAAARAKDVFQILARSARIARAQRG